MDQRRTPIATVTRLPSCAFTAATGLHEEMDQRAIACFDQALEDGGLADEELRRVLPDYFAWAATTTMALYHESADDVPAGLHLPNVVLARTRERNAHG